MTDRTTINVTKDAHQTASELKEQEGHSWSEVLEWYANHVSNDDIGQENNPMQEFDWSEFDRRLQNHLNEWEVTVNLDQLDLEPVNMDEQDVERIVERELEKTFGDRLPQ
ncbi:hypothetical protein HATV-3_gp6 [Haloarcula tailed virus 3]|uniref:Uncharacterized protein n=1 Tax=Haloarcula tailed virus 3 TaxID=2877990 RepID=A0AAE8XZI0_9CAUD|nr:hypothetical protein M1M35_gp06 [Haloarcula tailed virus 3]UBF23356.1 hypothetical protein HATV-3_gp6 [Haloarcula tailed virus 3]